ncbi:MAG: orotate phosphoribosyltransferase [Actinomycetota bacterium]
MLKVIKQSKNINVLEMLESSGAILEGHFKLTSGYHSAYYLQCAKLLMHPDLTRKLADESRRMLAESINLDDIDLVVSPAMGGILFGYMLAYRLGKDMIYTERKKEKMELRRGFKLSEGQKVVIAEDVITTGGSVKEVIEICRQNKAEVLAVVSIVDRSEGIDFKLFYNFLIKLEIDKFLSQECTMCRQGKAIDTPGSSK